MQTGQPPWHLWGGSEVYTVDSAVSTPQGPPNQLVNIQYGRPETWRFMIATAIVAADAGLGAGQLVVQYTLNMGLGRAQLALPLGVFKFVWAGPEVPLLLKFTNNCNAPAQDDLLPNLPNVVNTFSAETVYVSCAANLTLQGEDPGKVQVQSTAFFSPAVHVRPEWHQRQDMPSQGAQFPGREMRGR